MTNETLHSPRRLLPVLFLGVLMVALDIAIVGPSQPSIQNTFGVSERALSWILGIFVLCNLLGLPLMTKLSDVFGRRTVYTIDVALFGVGSLVVALAPSGGRRQLYARARKVLGKLGAKFIPTGTLRDWSRGLAQRLGRRLR